MSRSAQPFGRYELLERISAGGMAEVFKARDSRTGSIVALKRILPQVAEDDEFVKMFEDEARIASQLEHPHIARTLDFGHVDDAWYIAFEYVAGRDLRAVFDRSARIGEKPPLPFLLYVFARIGEGLAYAHARKDDSGAPQSIVHRDVSPQNIVVSFDGDVKLIDFGIAKAAGKLSRTQVGTLKGKFGYMAPEQIKGHDVDHRADVFSLGICMWELLTLERLFSGENELLVLEKVRSMTIAPPSTRNHDVPPELDRIVLKALAKELNERYRAAKDLLRDLEKLAQSIGATATRDEVARYMRGAFPESLARRPTPSELGLASHSSSNGPHRNGRPPARPGDHQETSTMAADIPSSDKRGSDLDIFEGLGKKPAGAGSSRPASVPPPPPSRQGTPMVVKSDIAKKTLVGMAPVVGAASPSASPSRVPPPPTRSAPPPPPGRSSLPQVVPPPQRASVPPPPAGGGAIATPIAPPPAMTTRGVGSIPPAPSPPATAKSNLDMDWDDEDEATHIFDKPPKDEDDKAERAPRPAAGTPLAPPVAASASSAPMMGMAMAKSTLVGIPAPVPPPAPPPPRASAPPPPPPSNAFVRASAPPPAFPSPSSAPAHGMPPQAHTAPMGMPGKPMSVPPPAPPPPMNGTSSQAQGGGMLGQPQLPPVNAMPASLAARMEATQLVRPQTSRIGLIGTAIVCATLAAAVIVFLMMPRTGRINVTVADAKGGSIDRVEIFVDGKKQCDTAPCIVDQVSAGSHKVKVLAQGFDAPTDSEVIVEARKDAPVDFKLAAASKGTGIKVSGKQAGVMLYVDGKQVGPLPQELRDLGAGSHQIKLQGSDRYAPLEKNVIVAQDEIQDLGDQTLKVVKGKATITLSTPGARVSIVSGSDRREFPTLPIAVDLDTTKPWALEASKAGFADYHQQVTFDDGVAEKTFDIKLDPKSAPTYAAAPAAAPAPAPVAARESRPSPPPTPKPAPAPKETKDTSSDDSSSGGGSEAFLNINSIPASSVVIDGKPIGNTPKVHYSVSPGAHTVVFVNSDQGLKKQITVNVGAGETKPAIARLRD